MTQDADQTGAGNTHDTRRAPTSPARTTTSGAAAAPGKDETTMMGLMQAKMALVAAREQGGRGALQRVLATYPHYVSELTEFSTALLATTSYEQEALSPDVEAIALRARTRALAAVFATASSTVAQPVLQADAQPLTQSLGQAPSADVAAETIRLVRSTAAVTSLRDLRRAHKLSPVALAQHLDLGVDVVSDLEAGLIRAASIPERLVRILGEVLDATTEQVKTILQSQAPALPALLRSTEGASKATHEATQTREFSAAVEHSPNMSPDQKTRWLDAYPPTLTS